MWTTRRKQKSWLQFTSEAAASRANFLKRKKKFLSFVAASVCFEIHRRDSERGGRMMSVGIWRCCFPVAVNKTQSIFKWKGLHTGAAYSRRKPSVTYYYDYTNIILFVFGVYGIRNVFCWRGWCKFCVLFLIIQTLWWGLFVLFVSIRPCISATSHSPSKCSSKKKIKISVVLCCLKSASI